MEQERAPSEKASTAKALGKKDLRTLFGIFKYVLPYKAWFIAGLFALGVSTLILLSFPRLAGELFDTAQGNGKYFDSINDVTLALLTVLLLQGVFSFVRVYTFSIVNEKAMRDLRAALYRKVIWLPMTFFDNRRVGELMSRITSDVGTLQDMFSFTLAELLRQVLTVVVGTTFLFVLAPSLTVFMLLTFPVLVLSALFFGKFIRKLSKRTQDKLADANVVVEESLQSASVVKAFTNETLQINRYTAALQEVVDVALHAARYRSAFIAFVIFAIFGGIVGVAWYGAQLLASGELTLGLLLSFIFYTPFIGFSIGGLGDIYAQVQKSIGASERVMEILGQTDESSRPGEKLRLKGEIEFDQVSFSYPTRPDYPVLQKLDFTISAGEKVALVGQSGAGKSTIINLLMRFYPLSGGAIRVDKRDIQSLNLTAYRENIGIVPQEVILFGGTIFENIRYGNPGASEEAVHEAARKANALEFIERFPEKFNTVVGDRGVKLSGGQRQRIAIARAILKDPAILILDEATSSLDAHSEALVQQALEKLMEGRTTLIIAHRLSTIRKADRIFVIEGGRLAEVGSHDELTGTDGIYNNLLKLQLMES